MAVAVSRVRDANQAESKRADVRKRSAARMACRENFVSRCVGAPLATPHG
jgi:hypothetical protein